MMRAPVTVQTFLQKTILRYAGLGFVLLLMISVTVAFLLSREQMASDLEKSAHATVNAFHDRIVDGDIRAVEPQIKQMLGLGESESAQILKTDLTRFYESFDKYQEVKPCTPVGSTCFADYFGQARIVYPIFFDPGDEVPYRYLYLSRQVTINWSYWLTVVLVFAIGYMGLVYCFLRISGVATGRLEGEIAAWSQRLEVDAKNAEPLVQPPFAELLTLKSAIEGLHRQIADYEKKAGDQAKLLLLRGIAHDLLTPVAQLQLYIGSLQQLITQKEHAEIIEEIIDSLKKVSTIASQVKALKEVESPNEQTELVNTAAEEIKTLRNCEDISTKGINLRFKSDCSALISPFSRAEISRILSNLVQNAADASQKGASVDVEVSREDGLAVLSVIDQGCGIPDYAKSRIFDPDFTLKPSSGTGLGLAIVKYICSQRSAKIELETEINKGTKITIKVPTILEGAHV